MLAVAKRASGRAVKSLGTMRPLRGQARVSRPAQIGRKLDEARVRWIISRKEGMAEIIFEERHGDGRFLAVASDLPAEPVDCIINAAIAAAAGPRLDAVRGGVIAQAGRVPTGCAVTEFLAGTPQPWLGVVCLCLLEGLLMDEVRRQYLK